MKQDRSLPAVLFMGLAAGFLLGGYEFIRSTANTLFKSAYGKESLPFIMTLVPFALICMLYIYGLLISRFGPKMALRITSGFSFCAIITCYLACEAGWKPATGFLFILRDTYIVLVLEQYWSYMVSTLKSDDAKKLNGIFCGIASIGSIIGASGVGYLSEPFGTVKMLLFGAASLLPAVIFSEMTYRKCGEPENEKREESGGSDHLGLRLFRANPELVFLFLVIFATQGIAAVLDISFQGILQTEMPSPDLQNAFSGKFFAWLNAGAAFGQFFLSPICLKFLSLSTIHLGIPLLHLVTCGYLFAYPSLFSAGLAFFLFKTLDYSVFRAAKEVLYIPFSFDVRFRAKELIDVFGYRFGKGGTSLAITVGQKAGLVFSDPVLAGLAWVGVFVWFFAVHPIVRSVKKQE